MSNTTRKTAIKRLKSDLKELKLNPLPNISAEPLPSDLFEWHCNILAPDDTCYHVILYIPENYPFKAPSAEFAPNGFRFPDTHFTNGTKGTKVCLSIFSDFSSSHSEWKNEINQGWSTAYTVQTILLSTVAMFSPVNHPYLADNKTLVQNYSCPDCGHSTDKPYPPFCTEISDATNYESHSLYASASHDKVDFNDEHNGSACDISVSSACNSTASICGSAGDVPAESDVHSSCDDCVSSSPRLANGSKEERPSSSQSQSVISSSVCSLDIYDYISKEQICITHSMTKDMIFGFGVTQTSNTRNKLYLTTPYEYMSRQSFYAMKELHGSVESAMRVKLHAFLPLYIHRHHAAVIKDDFIKCINKLGKFQSDHIIWKSTHRNEGIIRTMCLLMMSTIEGFSDGAIHVSEAKVRGLFELHRLFVWALDTYPNLREDIDNGVDEFIQHERKRHIKNVPQLAEWLMTLIMSSKCRLSEVLPLYMEEHCRRDVYKLVSSNSNLGDKAADKRYRITHTLKLTQESRKIFVMQVFMVRLLRSGNFTGEETEILQKIKNGAEKVVPKAIKSYDELYKFLDFTPTATAFESLVDALDFAVKTSGYHPSADDYLGGWKEVLYPDPKHGKSAWSRLRHRKWSKASGQRDKDRGRCSIQ